ncbi:hypothetical protein GF407_05735 [candidate division KSB1 bacterium]|nr:hypothetical protein [candidate division KSB1 bacterium]
MKSNFYFLLIMLFLFQCTYSQKQSIEKGGQLPQWVHEPHKSYPQSMYLVGIGSGDTRLDAENVAIGNIAKIFQATVKVDETLLENYLESDEQSRFTTQMLNKTRVTSNQDLKNITIAKSFFYENEGLYYVLAYLDRMETEELYRQDMESNIDKAMSFYNAYKESQNKLSRYVFLQKAIDLLRLNEALNTHYQIISTMGDKIQSPLPLEEMERDRLALLNQIGVEVIVNGDKESEIRDYLHQVVGKIGFKIVQSDADFTFDARFDLNPADLGRDDITGYNWKLTTDVHDNVNNYMLRSFTLKNRTMAISPDQALAKIMNTVQKELNSDFNRQFMEYIRKL